MKLRTIHHVSEHCSKGLQDQRPQVKVMARPSNLWAKAQPTFRQCAVEAHLFRLIKLGLLSTLTAEQVLMV